MKNFFKMKAKLARTTGIFFILNSSFLIHIV